jgi:hypothetical protein
MNLFIELLLCAYVPSAIFIIARCRQIGRVSRIPITPDWIEELAVDRYRIMLRRLDGNEPDSLGPNPASAPPAKAHSAAGCRIFRACIEDFHRVCSAFKLFGGAMSGLIAPI